MYDTTGERLQGKQNTYDRTYPLNSRTIWIHIIVETMALTGKAQLLIKYRDTLPNSLPSLQYWYNELQQIF